MNYLSFDKLDSILYVNGAQLSGIILSILALIMCIFYFYKRKLKYVLFYFLILVDSIVFWNILSGLENKIVFYFHLRFCIILLCIRLFFIVLPAVYIADTRKVKILNQFIKFLKFIRFAILKLIKYFISIFCKLYYWWLSK